MGTIEAIMAFMALLAGLAAAFSPEMSEDESEETDAEKERIVPNDTGLQTSLVQDGLFFEPISL